jgi:hypothetical protein
MCRVERVAALPLPRRVPQRRERPAARVADQPLGLLARQPRAPRDDERREPEPRAAALGADLARERRESVGKARGRSQPVADEGLEAVVDLHHVERDAQLAQRAQVAAHVVGRDLRSEAVPRAPAAG